MADQLRAAHVVVHGIVQGVGFRFYTEDAATRYGINGWVRNLPSGAVEARLEGSPDRVERMIEWLRHGPSSASVSTIEVEDAAPQGLRGFSITG